MTATFEQRLISERLIPRLRDAMLFVDRDHPDDDAANDPAYREAAAAYCAMLEVLNYLGDRLPD